MSVRYRGYVYDHETGLYYLQSRYYDPETGRFLNADDVDFIGSYDSTISYNIYAYCENSPVNKVDYLGYNSIVATYKPFINLMTAIVMLVTATTVAGGTAAVGALNPVGLAVGAGVLVVGVAGVWVYYNYATKSIAVSDTKVLSDTKAKQPKGKPYQFAYINTKGELKKVGKKLSFTEALTSLGIKKASTSLSKRYKLDENLKKPEDVKSKDWGIYAKDQGYAKSLAVVLKCKAAPEVHGSGYYGHYHDATHQIHIWYGNTIFY